MKTKTLLLVVVLILSTFAYTAFAQPHMKNAMQAPKMGLKNIPDLTTEQLSQIEKLRLEHQKQTLPVRNKLQMAELELKSLMLDNANESKLDKQIEEIGKLRTEMMKLHTKHRLEVQKLLTDEQKVYFDARGFGHRGKSGRMMRGAGDCYCPGEGRGGRR